jgi:hypothetical protein
MKSKTVCLLATLLMLAFLPIPAAEFKGIARSSKIQPSANLPFQVTETKPVLLQNKTKEGIKTAVILRAKQYGKLEKSAAVLRSSKASNPDGSRMLYSFYDGFTIQGIESDENTVADLRAWVQAKPESITARVALANFLKEYAWKARGYDYAKTVSNKGWQLFEDRLNEAQKVLDEAKMLKEKCPVYWRVQMEVALGLQMDRTQFDDIFTQATNDAPKDATIYLQRAVYLLPRWDGKDGELEADLEKSADAIGGEDGDMFYAQVVWQLHGGGLTFENIIKENHFSWLRVDRGFAVIEKQFPNSLEAKSERAYLAAYAGDAPKAREYLIETDGKAILDVWRYKAEYIRAANWAFDNK